MKVKNILKNCAQILNLDDILLYLENGENLIDEVQGELKNLMLAVNMVNNNLASNYIDLIGKKSCVNNEEIISFDKISTRQIIEIKNVFLNGKSVEFKVLPDGLKTSKGNIEILFSYFPDCVFIDDDINYYTKINELIFAQGVAGEFLFLKGDIEDAYMWDKKFKQSLINLLRPKKNFVMPAKRWL